MVTTDNIFWFLGVVVVIFLFVNAALVGLFALVDRPMDERSVSRLAYGSGVAALTATLAILGMMLALGTHHVAIELGHWVVIEEEHFHFSAKLIFDRLSVPFVILTLSLCGTIGAFANAYLHRERGYYRFFLCFTLFQLGMIVSSVAGTIEMLFVGWELVGLSSALLVAFFQERQNPVRNGVRVWSVYRIADAAFLVAAVSMHHLTGEGDFEAMTGAGPWPLGSATLTSSQALFVGSLLLVAVAGKSALIPFSGWLPRAMEGPTPSSAIFYGALSVHLGAFLLLRVSAVLEKSPILCVLVVLLGASTAVMAALAARVQTDIKSLLAFASLTQVGIIVAEIGMGLRYIALAHILGHACYRTLQLLRAPSLLRDHHLLENAIGSQLPKIGREFDERVTGSWQTWLYRFALDRGIFDAILSRYIVEPVLMVLRRCDDLERRWTTFLSGGHPRVVESDDPLADPPRDAS
jgi:NAD(P)H-quinone oxidoreductase subunit 5